MTHSARILKEKLDYMLLDTSVTKEDCIDILLMSLEEGISVQQAISDCYISGFDDELIDLESLLEDNDRAYDEYKDSRIRYEFRDLVFER